MNLSDNSHEPQSGQARFLNLTLDPLFLNNERKLKKNQNRRVICNRVLK